jgi:hypothetical protein
MNIEKRIEKLESLTMESDKPCELNIPDEDIIERLKNLHEVGIRTLTAGEPTHVEIDEARRVLCKYARRDAKSMSDDELVECITLREGTKASELSDEMLVAIIEKGKAKKAAGDGCKDGGDYGK